MIPLDDALDDLFRPLDVRRPAVSILPRSLLPRFLAALRRLIGVPR